MLPPNYERSLAILRDAKLRPSFEEIQRELVNIRKTGDWNASPVSCALHALLIRATNEVTCLVANVHSMWTQTPVRNNAVSVSATCDENALDLARATHDHLTQEMESEPIV